MCDNFSPQAWRKQHCQHCFEAKDAHVIADKGPDQEEERPPPPRVFSKSALTKSRKGGAGPCRPRRPPQGGFDDVVVAAAAVVGGYVDVGAAPEAGLGDAAAAAAAGVAGHLDVAARGNDDDGGDDLAPGDAYQDLQAIGDAFVPPAPPLPDGGFAAIPRLDAGDGDGHGDGDNDGEAVEVVDENAALAAAAAAARQGMDENAAPAAAAAAARPGVDENVAPAAAAAAARPVGVGSVMEAIRGGIPLRHVSAAELEERRKSSEKPADMHSEMVQRLQGRSKAANVKARAVVDAQQNEIERIVSELNGLRQDAPVRIIHLKALCREADRLKSSLTAKMEVPSDRILEQRVSWPILIHQMLESVVRMIELVEAAIARVKEVAALTREAGVDANSIPVVNSETVSAALQQLTTNVLLLSRDTQQDAFLQLHVSRVDVALLLEEVSPPCIYLLDCLFNKALHSAQSLSEIGLSRYALTFRVNHTTDLLRTACELNTKLMQCLSLPRHTLYSDAQLTANSLKEKYGQMQAVHQKTGQWDAKEQVSLRSSTSSSLPPGRTRMSTKASFERNALASIAEDRRDDFHALLSNCKLEEIEVIHSAVVHTAVNKNTCEVVSWVVQELRLVEGVLTPAREFEWLHEALTKSTMEVVSCLVQSCGIDINSRSQDMGNTLLHAAARRQDLDAMASLVNLGADILLLNAAAHTPLQMLALKCFPTKPLIRAKEEGNDCFADYVNNPNLSDLVLVCDGSDGTKEKCYAHRVLLCGRSAVFKSMLDTEHWPEASQGEVCLPELRYAVLLFVMQYVYTGACFYPFDDLNLGIELLAASNRFLLSGMSLQVEFVLCNKIDAEVAIPLYQAAYLYSAPALLREACHYILFNYAKLSDPDHEALFHILKNQRPSS